MPAPYVKPEWQRAIVLMSTTLVTIAIVGTLYFARSIFIPLTLAIFLTFVLAPVILRLERRGVGRVPSTVAVVAVALGLFGLTAWLVTAQMAALTKSLPDHADNIKTKVTSLKEMFTGGGSSRLGVLFDELQKIVNAEKPLPKGTPESPTAVVIESPTPSWAGRVEGFVSPLMEFIGQAAFSFILVVFMLLKKEDLRNRVLRLIGHGRVTTATKAVDDASQRVSNYLLTQLLVNTSFGVIITIGLFIFSVPYAIMWGFIATVMRYIPYIGTWLGVIPPVVFTFAISDGYGMPLSVFGLFIGLEMICNNFVEPRLYGSSLGVSEVAQLVSAAFWSFLWGPVGLILSGPLTTCLLVLGKYVPHLHFLEVLLGDEPPLEPGVALFQRLAARDHDEATRILQEQLKEGDFSHVADRVLVSALCMTREAIERGELTAEEEKTILEMTGQLLEEIVDELPQAEDNTGELNPVKIMLVPARDATDQIAVEILAKTLPTEKWTHKVIATETLTSELLDEVFKFEPAVMCIGSLPPGGQAHTRYLCKRLRTRFPNMKIMVGRWGLTEEIDTFRKEMIEAGADEVTTLIADAVQNLKAWHPVFSAPRSVEPTSPENTKNRPEHELVGTAGA